MQFNVAFRVIPYKLVVALQLLLVVEGGHGGADRIVLLGADENINVAHGTHFGLGVDSLQVRALDHHVVDPLLVEGPPDTAQLVHLALVHGQLGAGGMEQELNLWVGQGKLAALNQTVIKQGCYPVFLGDIDPFLKLPGIHGRDGCIVDCAFQNPQEIRIYRRHITLRKPARHG